VYCYDNASNLGVSQLFYFDVDNNPPSVQIYEPNGTLVNTPAITFNYTVIDNYNLIMGCNLTVNGTVESINITSNNGSVIEEPIAGLPDGFQYWNVSCWDSAFNIGYSETYNFTKDSAPEIYLGSVPEDGNATTTGDVVFYYEVEDSALSNCSLVLNYVENTTTNVSEIPYHQLGNENNFTLNNMGEGTYIWTVNCTDANGFEGMALDGEGGYEERALYVDFYNPWVILNGPENDTNLSTSVVRFNFTAYDTVDQNLTCNLTINSSVNVSNTWALNGTAREILVTNFSGGEYFWSVACWDDAYHYNFTDTWQFTLISTPSVVLIAPGNGSTIDRNRVNLSFIASDLEGISFCDVIVDGSYEDTVVPENGVKYDYDKQGLTEDKHTWYINCSDTDSNIVLSTTWEFYVDLNAPWVQNNHPNGTWHLTETVTFNWTAYDGVDDSLVCDLYVNKTKRVSGFDSPNGTAVNTTLFGFTDGQFFWNVTCYDNTTRSNTSSVYNFTIQVPPRVSLINPPNFTRTNEQTQTFYYIPYDNSNTSATCALLLNLETNTTNSTITTDIINNLSTSNLQNGVYNWTVNCTDYGDNSGFNASERVLIIDLLGPDIDLIFPVEGGTYNYEDMNFTWNATDLWGTNLECNITIDDKINVSGISTTSGEYTNRTIYGLAQGVHNWSVQCIDDLNNSASYGVVNFTINAPDLTLNNTHIVFNNTNPDASETIRINATIYNIGGAAASDIPVEFWDGLPGSGSMINGVQTIASLSSGSSATVGVDWDISLGMHNIYVIINYTGVELNSTNNNATKSISVLYPAIYEPVNNSWTNETDVEINFTIIDSTGGLINYSILLDGALNGQHANVTDGIARLLNVTLTEGRHTIQVRATDYLGREKDSAGIVVWVDQTDPTPVFDTNDGWWFNDPTPEINFTVIDNMDLILNYSLFVDYALENKSLINNGTYKLLNLSSLVDNSYVLTLNGTDNAGNLGTTSITIYVDTFEPTIFLEYPGEGDDLISTTTELNFSVADNLDTSLGCNLTLDGSDIRTEFAAATGNTINTTVYGLSEGTHYWNATCWDGSLTSNVNNINTSETRSFNVYVAPNITLIEPENNNWTSETLVLFYFDVSDDTGLNNCSILIDNVVNDTKQIADLENNGRNNFTVSNLYGTYNWSIQCYDSTSQYMYYRSEDRIVNVDPNDPVATIETKTETWFNTPTQLIRFNITDDMDDPINYTLFANETVNAAGTAVNGSSTSDLLTNLQNGTYFIVLEALDEAYNRKNSSTIKIHIDTVEPDITLIRPENENSTTETDIYFNYSVTDNLSPDLLCDLTVDNVVRESFNSTNGGNNDTTLAMTAGTHYWNVTCADIAGNIKTSETWSFSIPLPDITLTSNDINFNETLPQEGKNITINTTVFNIGDTDAFNVTIQFFEGNYNLSNQISGNYTFDILAGENVTVNVSWKVSGVGNVDIYVVADPPIATQGKVQEADEENNFAYKTIVISSYATAYGNLTGLKTLEDMENKTIFGWNVTQYNGTLVYAVDIDSSVNWAELQAISRDTTNGLQFDDFDEIDIAIQMQNNSDSINRTWTENNVAKLTKSYTVFRNAISNVPIVNSTNTSNFLTGILWDKDDGNTEFNGTQDLVFLTTVNVNQQGKLGVYDYELRLPANLRLYKGPNTATVSLYTEIP